MRKRCRRTPRPVLKNPLKYVLDGLTPMRTMKEDVERLRIKNHGALQLIVIGRGKKEDVDVLIAATNMAVAIKDVCKLGGDYEADISAMHAAVYSMARRGIETGRFVFTGPELQAVNAGMEVHDAQIDICTVQEIEKACAYVKKEIGSGRARVIPQVSP